jgi:hypothetical protein
MPSSVAGLCAAAGLAPEGAVRWGAPVPETRPGVYLITLTAGVAAVTGTLPEMPVDADCLRQLLNARPELRLDGKRPAVADLRARLAAFWLPDEVVVYIGLAGQPLARRVAQYYCTPLGAKRPHAGGWWLKTFAALDNLWVHYATTPDFRVAELTMLSAFAAAVSAASREALPDAERVARFANLRAGDELVKRHGITGATGDLGTRAPTAGRSRASEASKQVVGAETAAARRQHVRNGGAIERSQTVTVKDRAAGRIRFPRAAKGVFPLETSELDVTVRGTPMRARWDRRLGPDKERSGVLAFGRGKLEGLVLSADVLTVTRDADGRVSLG